MLFVHFEISGEGFFKIETRIVCGRHQPSYRLERNVPKGRPIEIVVVTTSAFSHQPQRNTTRNHHHWLVVDLKESG